MENSPVFKTNPEMQYLNLRISRVSPILMEQKIFIVWRNGEQAVLDFADIIREDKHFHPMVDSAVFQSVRVEDWGACIEWKCGVGMGSDQLRQMAEEQESVFKKRKVG